MRVGGVCVCCVCARALRNKLRHGKGKEAPIAPTDCDCAAMPETYSAGNISNQYFNAQKV